MCSLSANSRLASTEKLADSLGLNGNGKRALSPASGLGAKLGKKMKTNTREYKYESLAATAAKLHCAVGGAYNAQEEGCINAGNPPSQRHLQETRLKGTLPPWHE